MFSNMGLHVIKNPAGTYSYVGSIPTVLADIVPADTAAVMGQRSFTCPNTGEILMYKFPVFATEKAAIRYATEKKCEVTK